MNNLLKKCFFIAGVLTLSYIGTAQAGISIGDTIKFADGPGSPGGVYYATDITKNISFNTFCIEKNEYLNFYDKFIVQDISTEAKLGGEGGASNGTDPLSYKTAYLFQNFAYGTLAGYTNDDTQNNLLQKAIWYFEGEVDADVVDGNSYVALAEAANWTDYHNVRVLNIVFGSNGHTSGYNQDGNYAQDVLTVNAVPIPAAALLLGTGLAGLIGTRVRRKK